jgi:hypothetical protein
VTALAGLRIGDDPYAWAALGLDLDAGHDIHVGTVRLTIDSHAPQRGFVEWTVTDAPDPTVTDVDGLPTRHGGAPSLPGLAASHLLGVTQIDHLVVRSPDLDRTVGAFQHRLGLTVRQVRDVSTPEAPLAQAFFRMGEVIVEVVGPPGGTDGAAHEPARFAGLAFTVISLEAAVDFLGDELVSPPRPAVQPEREIAVVRAAAGLAVPVALMSS